MFTTTLNNGTKVIAKNAKDAKQYTNDSQAIKAADALKASGVDCEVYIAPMSRVRYIKIN